MKTRIIVQVYSEGNELLSETTREIIKSDAEADKTSLTGLSMADYQKTQQAIDQAQMEARLKRSFF